MDMQFHVPAQVAVLPQALPLCCARHGAPAAEWKPVMFESRPPLWVYLTLVFGFLPTLIILVSMRRQIHAPYWPFCAQCLDLHRLRGRRAYIASGAWLGACILAFGIGAGFASDATLLVAFLCAAFGTPLVAAAVASQAGWSSIADGVAARDGRTVVFPRPAPLFVTALTTPWAPRPW